jgi:hypothetical protein
VGEHQHSELTSWSEALGLTTSETHTIAYGRKRLPFSPKDACASTVSAPKDGLQQRGRRPRACCAGVATANSSD